MKFWCKLVVLLTLVLSTAAAFGNNYPYPGKRNPVPCTGCTDGNKDLPTFPYNDPIVAHVGRFVDSSRTINAQHIGMRTIRARAIRPNLGRKRVYLALGETVGSYNMDTFFTSVLKQPMQLASALGTGTPYGRYTTPIEKIAVPDSFLYPEAKQSGWATEWLDHQVNLTDFDSDDRGNVYVGNLYWGWGISRDTGVVNGQHMTFVEQVRDTGIEPNSVISIKVGAKYYAVIASAANSNSAKQVIYDVTTPGSPVRGATRTGKEFGISSWTKNDDLERIAIIHPDGVLRIYSYASLLTGTAIATFTPSGNQKYVDAAIDEAGRIWVAQLNSNQLVRLMPSGSSYIATNHSVYGGAFTPNRIAAAGGYVAVGGKTDAFELRLFKLEGSNPVPVDTDNFFRKYYFSPPLGYAAPTLFVPAYTSFSDVGLVEHGNKVYLIFSAEGLGDVYEIEAGEAIAASMVPNFFGTPNPNAKFSEPGPYYGDILKFKATSNNASASYSIDWNFGNPEAPTNIRQTDLGQEIEHQFTGLTTDTKITTPKIVSAKATSDASITSEVAVTLKVPTARVGIPGRAQAMTTANKEPFVVVAGDEFTDASDGSIESHYSSWTIDNGTPVKIKPNGKIPVGALGGHTLTMAANYGMYDEATLTGTSPYTVNVSGLTYTVKPFTARILAPTTSGLNLTFNAEARATSDRAILNATQWTVTWLLVGATGASTESVEAAETKTVNVGTVPPFVVPKTLITHNSKITLQISVPTTAVPAGYDSVSVEQIQIIPDPTIAKTGCANAGDPCTLTAKSLTNSPTDSWRVSWSVKLGSTEVATGTSNPIVFTPVSPGSYTATVTDTVFGKTSNTSFTVASALCGPVPITENVALSTDCGTDCQKDVDIEFSASLFHYTIQPCDTLTWDFGDNGKGTGDVAKHKYTANGNYTVKFTIKNTNTSGANTLIKSLAIKIGGGVVEPPPTCVAPTAITFDWLGSKGCSPSKSCEVGESVKFTARRGASALLNCDTTQWNINGTTTTVKSPSHTFSSTGSFNVSLIVSNSEGTSPSVPKTVNVTPATGSCTGSVPDVGLSVEFEGAASNCFAGGSGLCQAGETIQFRPAFFGYSPQACDRYEWDFGDGSAKSSQQEPTHVFADPVNRTVTLRMYNTNNPTGVTKTVDVLFSTAPIKQLPVIGFANPPATGAVGVAMTFNATSDINATGWVWNFGDDTGNNNSQSSQIGKASSLSHTFTKAGTFTVRVTARNSEETNTNRTNFALAVVTIAETPEYRYLLPVVTHGAGQNNSVWRTDVQIYNPDPQVSAANQLELKATFNGADTTLRVAQSTYIFEDFMQRLTTANTASGPVILSTRAKFPPQIWTRTYNQTENGTFGQFIPAIRLDAAGGGSAVGTGKYFLAGLRNDTDYRTNIGFVNPNGQAITVHVAAYDDQGLSLGQFDRTLQPFVLDQFPITHPTALPGLKGDRPFSLEMSVPEGQWLLSYASSVNNKSGDPVYLQAIRQSELASPDFRDVFVPGVGRTGAWRSDVTVFNPHNRKVTVDLTFHDAAGAVKGEAKNVPIDAGAFLQYNDLLRQGIFGSLADSVGVLRVAVPSTVSADHFPMTFARTYNDDGTGKTYGQGIGGFAGARANVKPGKPALLAAVRNVQGKYYTNIGLTNVSGTSATVTAKVLDPDTGAEINTFSYSLNPFQSIVQRLDIGSFANASIKVEVTGGHIWCFASQVDDQTKDPEYLSATPLQ